ncbi:MAG TPA: hypothetical protein VD971_11015 [Phycisphaerales bacterium]|nr:hypothetical protein [Phycisphaerales bacterium]
MPSESVPSFEVWSETLVTFGYADPRQTRPPTTEESARREQVVYDLDAPTLTDYLTRLFENPAWIADRVDDEQIGVLTQFVFGCETCFMHEVQSPAVPQEAQARCFRSVATLYTDLLDRVCGRRGADPDLDPRNAGHGVDGVVYMMWDMDGGVGSPINDATRKPHLVEPSIHVLNTALNHCRTSACRLSALHGLGHAVSLNRSTNLAFVLRLQAVIGVFLERSTGPEWLRAYANNARDGCVL